MRNVLGAIALSILVGGCATQPLQNRRVIAASSDLPRQVVLKQVPFLQQEAGYCGPASLAMAMRAAGKPGDLAQITEEVYTPSSKGTLQLDLISASRRHALMAVPVASLRDLLKEVAGGHPVVVFENLGLSWWPQWHYAVVTGYDLPTEKIIVHSGDQAFQAIEMDRFEFAWRMTQNWGVVILSPEVLSVTADDLKHVKAAAGLELAGHKPEAETAYRAILARWPQSLGALIGMGNVKFSQGEFASAVDYLTRATQIAPDSQTARHNLAVATAAAHRRDSL